MSKTLNSIENKKVQIPPPYAGQFENGICHPLLYLWDAWSYVEADIIHLYCLAGSRLKLDGTPLQPAERNYFPFHVRHFTSDNNGRSWKDEGCFLETNISITSIRRPLHLARELCATKRKTKR